MTLRALGGLNPQSLKWKIDSDQYITQYAMMKNNIFQLCVNPKYQNKRDLII